MNKSIFSAAGIAAVVAAFCVGCGGNNNPVDSRDKLVGEWRQVEPDWDLDKEKGFFSFKPSNDFEMTVFQEGWEDYWVEITMRARYGIRGDSVCLVSPDIDGEQCFKYEVSGNNLTLYDPEGDDEDQKFVRDNIANVRKSLGTVYVRDAALLGYWVKPPELSEIYFSMEGFFRDYDSVYTSGGEKASWYTDSGFVFLLEAECDRWDPNDDYHCDFWKLSNTVRLQYGLQASGALRLRAPGANNWDTWTRHESGQSKAGPAKGKRAVSPFWFFRR